jgi:hypothetical protein
MMDAEKAPFGADHVGSLSRPRCEFSPTVRGNDLTIELEKAKIHIVVETAYEV